MCKGNRGNVQDADFAVDLANSKFSSSGMLLFIGEHTFVPIS